MIVGRFQGMLSSKEEEKKKNGNESGASNRYFQTFPPPSTEYLTHTTFPIQYPFSTQVVPRSRPKLQQSRHSDVNGGEGGREEGYIRTPHPQPNTQQLASLVEGFGSRMMAGRWIVRHEVSPLISPRDMLGRCWGAQVAFLVGAVPAHDWAVCGIVGMTAFVTIPEVDWVRAGIVWPTRALHTMGGRWGSLRKVYICWCRRQLMMTSSTWELVCWPGGIIGCLDRRGRGWLLLIMSWTISIRCRQITAGHMAGSGIASWRECIAFEVRHFKWCERPRDRVVFLGRFFEAKNERRRMNNCFIEEDLKEVCRYV